MSSIRRHPNSPYWQACFSLPDGTRTNRSTGTTDRRKAFRLAADFEEASRAAKELRLSTSRARKTIADIYEFMGGGQLAGSKTSAFLDSWLKRKEIETEAVTHERYTTVVSQFKQFLGPKATQALDSVTAGDILEFRDDLSKRLAAGTVNISLKILRSAFTQARRDGLVSANVADQVGTLKRHEDQASDRRPFTIEELKRILEAADDEWRGMILFGLYTGQRLWDIATLTWQNVDLQRQELRLLTKKTGRRQIIPLAPPLLRYVERLPSSDNPGTPIFRRACATAENQGRTGSLSNQFYGVLVNAGLAAKKSHHADKEDRKGRTARRARNPISFHSLRHTATSLLRSTGTSQAVAMEFIGHESSSISQHYTHTSTESLKQAAANLPDVTK